MSLILNSLRITLFCWVLAVGGCAPGTSSPSSGEGGFSPGSQKPGVKDWTLLSGSTQLQLIEAILSEYRESMTDLGKWSLHFDETYRIECKVNCQIDELNL